MLVGDLSNVNRSDGFTCSPGFAGGTYHSSCVLIEVTRIELSARTARFSRKYPFGKITAVLNVAFCFLASIGYSKSSVRRRTRVGEPAVQVSFETRRGRRCLIEWHPAGSRDSGEQ